MKQLALFLAAAALAIASVGCTTVDSKPTTASTTSTKPAQTASSNTESSFKATARADRDNPGGVTPYPFNTCAVQWHKPFKDGKAKHRRVYKGQEVLFCCTPCVKAFDMNPDPYMPRILAAAN
ncbi:MAG: hypothetical protein AAGC68_12010 [Verrucomicrobiota bacterium]